MDTSPPFIAFPALNDAALARRLGLGGVAAGHARSSRLGRDTAAVSLAFPSASPYDKLARAVADRRCVAPKELVEAAELFARVRRRIRCATVVDLCAGHGLLGLLFACLEREVEQVVLLDAQQPAAFHRLLEATAEVAPWAAAKVSFLRADVTALPGAPHSDAAARPLLGDAADTAAACELLASLAPDAAGFTALHACGPLTDVCLHVAAHAQGSLALLPCCYTGTAAGTPPALRRALGVGWAADVGRVYSLERLGYTCDFACLPREITPMNRALIAVRRTKAPELFCAVKAEGALRPRPPPCPPGPPPAQPPPPCAARPSASGAR